MTPLQDRKYFASLTGLRAIAAYMVFFHHMILTYIVWVSAMHFYVGYIVFFVLSGFLITYHNAESLDLSWSRLRPYFIKRWARIFPVYLLIFSVFCWAHRLQWPEESFGFLFANLTLLKGWSANYIYTGISQAWTLTIQETFYVLAPLVFIFLRKKQSIVWLAIVAVGLGITQYALALASPSIHAFNDLYRITMSGFFFMFLPFSFGIAAAQLQLGQLPKLDHLLTRLGRLTAKGALLVVLALCLLEWDKPYPLVNFYFQWIQVFCVLVLAPMGTALLILGLVRERTWFSRFLGSSVMVLLGKSSYVLCLIHSGVIADWLLQYAFVGISGSYVWAALFIAINLISIALYKLFEEPVAKFIRQKI